MSKYKIIENCSLCNSELFDDENVLEINSRYVCLPCYDIMVGKYKELSDEILDELLWKKVLFTENSDGHNETY